MRILRVRRGFTTNSSGANEFLPDGGVRAYDGGTPAPTSPPVLTTVRPWGEAPQPIEPSSNAATLGVASLVVAGAFLVVPVVRLLRRRKVRKEPERDEP